MTTFNDPGASASFTFQGASSYYQSTATASYSESVSGTAVYLSYPLWPYKVSSGWISLDGRPPVRVSLQDPNHSESDGGRATMPSSVQYFADGLDPGVEHSILVTATDADTFVVFDSIMCVHAKPLSYHTLT